MDSGETPSSTSDFYAADTPDKAGQIAPAGLPDMNQNQEATMTTHHDDTEDQAMDSSSEAMDISDASRSASPEPIQKPLPQPLPQSCLTGVKRSLDEDARLTNGDEQASEYPNQRRRMLSPDTSHAIINTAPSAPQPTSTATQPTLLSRGVNALPTQVWQQVFLKLPATKLGLCMRICKTFKRILTDTRAAPAPRRDDAVIQILSDEQLWRQVRQTLYPQLPRPLAGHTELQMFKLLGAGACHHCHRIPTSPPANILSAYERGPGPSSARVIWPLAAVLCGTCLRDLTIKDTTLLTRTGGHFRSALPHIFLTPSLHYVPEGQRNEAPTSARLGKVYLQRDVDAIVFESGQVLKDLGPGAFDEWKKGLNKKGTERMADAARWEVWEKNLSTDKSIPQVLREYDLSLIQNSRDVTTSTGTRVGRPPVATNGTSTPSIKLEYDYPGASSRPPYATPAYQNGVQAPSMKFEFDYTGATNAPPYATPYQNGVQAPYGSSYGQDHKQASTTKLPQGIQAARQARRADIERRCMSLNPPILPEVLQHAPSFKNAMVVTQPMTDTAWNVLWPRLESQRDQAEAMEQQRLYQIQLAEHKRAEELAYLAAGIPSTPQDILRPARDVYSEAYENAQKPLREKLAAYADEFMRDEWHPGTLHRHNCPQFAAGCIEWVHKRDAEDEARRGGATVSSPATQHYARQAGHQEPRPFLSLDNMKWVFENKIKPLTDPHCKELFTCAECEEVPKAYTKHFAFEGLIQHYGAKHESEFGIENVVVHWQTAKWPEYPPFVIPKAPAPRVVNHNRDGRNGSGRTDNRPPPSRNGPSQTPRPQLLSETPYFSTQPRQSSGYNPVAHHQNDIPQDIKREGQADHAAAPSRDCPYVDTSNTAQVEKLVTDALEIWHALDGIKDLELPIRMHTVIYHTNQRFVGHFLHLPNLDTVTEALASDDRMLPIKKANGLICTECVAAQTDGSATAPAYYNRILHMKPFNVSSLVTHFKIVHQADGHYADWGTNMIELPEDKVVLKLLRTPGMDDAKLRLIAAAFHTVFPTPLPTIGVIPGDASTSEGSLVDRMLKAKKGNQSKKNMKGGNDVSAKTQRSKSEALSDAKEDEYDPKRPAYFSKDKPAFDPARYDTRYDTSIAHQSIRTASHVDINSLNTETLAALSNRALANYAPRSPDLSLLPLRNEGMTSEQPLQYRRPSVGAREPPPRQPEIGTPDIAAILASLTAQQPPAALGHNAQAYAHNLGRANTAQQPFSAAAAPPSPPRLRYEYEQPPVQWVQLPAVSARPPPPRSYIGGGAALPPVFVDENGREVRVVPGHYYQ